jgi:hypothetical protein
MGSVSDFSFSKILKLAQKYTEEKVHTEYTLCRRCACAVTNLERL